MVGFCVPGIFGKYSRPAILPVLAPSVRVQSCPVCLHRPGRGAHDFDAALAQTVKDVNDQSIALGSSYLTGGVCGCQRKRFPVFFNHHYLFGDFYHWLKGRPLIITV
jgi:hypothetical protein